MSSCSSSGGIQVSVAPVKLQQWRFWFTQWCKERFFKSTWDLWAFTQLHLTSCMEPFYLWFICPCLLQVFRKRLPHCFVVKIQKCFVDNKMTAKCPFHRHGGEHESSFLGRLSLKRHLTYWPIHTPAQWPWMRTVRTQKKWSVLYSWALSNSPCKYWINPTSKGIMFACSMHAGI